MSELVPSNEANPDVIGKIDCILTELGNGRPVLLRVGFDPAWQTLKDAYAFTHNEPPNFPGHTDFFNNRNPKVVNFNSALEFSQIYSALRQHNYSDSDAVRIGFKNDQRKLSSFIIDTPEKMKTLLRQITHIGTKPFNMGDDGTMLNFPRCFYFGPDSLFKVPGLNVISYSANTIEFAGASIGLRTGLLYLNENQRAAFNNAEDILLIASPLLGAIPVAGKRIDLEVNATNSDQFVVVEKRFKPLNND